jgi:homoserine kinase
MSAGAGQAGHLNRRRLVRVPASSANLGPGFDTFAAALSLRLELEVIETGRFAVETDLDVPRDRSNLAVRAFERLHSAAAFTFRMRSEIPLAGGLGSSAAATLAGLAAADHLFELDAPLLELAADMEGHADNVAAALHGGLVVYASGGAVRIDPPTGLEAIAVVPDDAVATTRARAALPAAVPLADAVFNVAHGAMLMLGLARGDWDLVSRGLVDRLHQDARAGLWPRSRALLDRARAFGALGATISGAGPTVLVWCFYEQTGGVVEALREEAEGWAQVVWTPFESQGLDVRSLTP